MATNLVLTVIGDDRPGLVESLSRVIAQHQGNWLESNMSHLAGKFAGILRVSVDDAHAEGLITELQQLSGSRLPLKVIVEKAAAPAGAPQTLRKLWLKLVGNDRPGIIRDISRALAAQHVNVDELVTECSSAPMSGEMLFHADALLRVPADLDIDALQSDLEQLADDLIVEVSLSLKED
jgi:glycine cleavage system regulatory protein